jgi:hypothetical protein
LQPVIAQVQFIQQEEHDNDDEEGEDRMAIKKKVSH